MSDPRTLPTDGNPPAPHADRPHRATGREIRCPGCGVAQVRYGGPRNSGTHGAMSTWCQNCWPRLSNYGPARNTLRYAGVRSVHSGATSHDERGAA
jgi:hypothetical protein